MGTALGDRRADDTAMDEAGDAMIGGIFCGAGDLREAVDAGSGAADVRGHEAAHAILLVGLRLRRAACRLRQRADDGLAARGRS